MASANTALLSCFSAALVASLCTLAVERLGGTLGGILASSPTTIIVFSVGASLNGSPIDLQHSLYAVPVGMATNSIFLLLWRELPATYAFQAAPCLRSAAAKLVFMCFVTVSYWLVGSIIMLEILRLVETWGWNFRVSGVICFMLLVFIGLAISLWKFVPSPKGQHKPHWSVYILRGILAGIAVGGAVLASQVSSYIAGLASCVTPLGLPPSSVHVRLYYINIRFNFGLTFLFRILRHAEHFPPSFSHR